MSRLVCLDCGYDMGDYIGDTVKINECPQCNSKNLQRNLFLTDNVKIHENVKGKSSKKPGQKKPQSEFQAGEEKSISRKKFVEKIRKIDRASNEYFERVTDPETGEIIHQCSEPLTKHLGHGSAKRNEEHS